MVRARVVRAGTGIRVGTGVGYTGGVPSRQGRTRKGDPDSEAGPGRLLQGAWSGWSGSTVPSTSAPTLRARSGTQVPSLVLLKQMPPLGQ